MLHGTAQEVTVLKPRVHPRPRSPWASFFHMTTIDSFPPFSLIAEAEWHWRSHFINKQTEVAETGIKTPNLNPDPLAPNAGPQTSEPRGLREAEKTGAWQPPSAESSPPSAGPAPPPHTILLSLWSRPPVGWGRSDSSGRVALGRVPSPRAPAALSQLPPPSLPLCGLGFLPPFKAHRFSLLEATFFSFLESAQGETPVFLFRFLLRHQCFLGRSRCGTWPMGSKLLSGSDKLESLCLRGPSPSAARL